MRKSLHGLRPTVRNRCPRCRSHILDAGLHTPRPIHHLCAKALAGPQLIDRPDRIDRRMQLDSCVEVLPDIRQQVHASSSFAGRRLAGLAGLAGDPRMLQRLVSSLSLVCVNDEGGVYERFGAGRDVPPVFFGSISVVCVDDGLHFFQVGVSVEGRVAREEEVCYYAYCPDITFTLLAS